MGIEGIPDYFKTHPGTGSRIAHLSGLLSDYTHDPARFSCPDTYPYDMVKYRIIGLYEPIKDSIKAIESKIAEDPSNPALYYGLGLLYARENRRDQAIEQLRKALSFNIMDPLVLLELGRIYTLDGRYDKAKTILSGIQSDPVLGISARYHLAVAQLESGDLTSARQNLTHVTETDPEIFPGPIFIWERSCPEKTELPCPIIIWEFIMIGSRIQKTRPVIWKGRWLRGWMIQKPKRPLKKG